MTVIRDRQGVRWTPLWFAVSLAVLAGCTGEAAPEQETAAEFSGTRTEYMQAQVDCLIELGWDAWVHMDPMAGPIIAADTGGTQAGFDAFAVDSDECEAALPAMPEPQSEAEFREMYDNLVERYECVIEAGYEPNPPPAFETWLESLDGDSTPWGSFDGLEDRQMLDAAEACPADPDAWW